VFPIDFSFSFSSNYDDCGDDDCGDNLRWLGLFNEKIRCVRNVKYRIERDGLIDGKHSTVTVQHNTHTVLVLTNVTMRCCDALMNETYLAR
jgi:hypothetical protein